MTPSKKPKDSFLKDLWNRRFFQYFVTYLGGAWALIQFAEWMVNRYHFDTALVDRLVLIIIFCLPAFLVFIYNHGRPGPDDWLPFEKVFIPLSAVLALLMATFAVKAQKETFTTVEVADIRGDTLKRIVPDADQFTVIGIFPAVNEVEDPEFGFLSLALSELIHDDLLRDSRIYPVHPLILYQQSGFPFDTYMKGLSRSQCLEIGAKYPAEFVLYSGFKKANGQYVITIEVLESNTGKAVYQNQMEGSNYYTLVDQISTAVIQAVFPDDALALEDIKDLPASDLISEKEDALREYALGYYQLINHSADPQIALPYFKRAVALDPDCAPCLFELGNTKILIDGFNAGTSELEKAVDLAVYLYDRIKYEYLARYLEVKSEYSDWVRLHKMMLRLYPFDYTSYEKLIEYYSSNDIDEAMLTAEMGVKNGFAKLLNKTIGDLYFKKADYESARNYYVAHLKNFPREESAKEQLIESLIALGEFREAKILLEESMLMYPNSVDPAIRLAEFERRQMADFSTSEKIFREALQKTKSLSDSSEIYYQLCVLSNQQGRIREALNLLQKSKEIEYKYEIPIITDFKRYYREAGLYWELGKRDTFKTITNNYGLQYDPLIPGVNCLLFLQYAENMMDTMTFLEFYPECKSTIFDVYGQDSKLYLHYDGILAYFRGEPCEARRAFYSYYDSLGSVVVEPDEVFIRSVLECGEIEEARELVNLSLKSSPHWPNTLYLSAMVAISENEPNQAVKSLEQALSVLANADDDNIVKHRCLTLLKQLKQDPI